MSESKGHIELERAVDSIVVGIRHRRELGDIDSLAASIRKVGLLQPVTITPDGVLVCGRRRLEAIKRLGWRTLRVWVRSGISDELSRLLAQQDENTERKPLTEREQARLFAELQPLLAEDGRRRQEATRFGGEGTLGEVNGAADSAAPRRGTGRGSGDTRRQAAELITEKASYGRLEQIVAMEKVTANRANPAAVRELAETELKAIDAGADVHPAYQRVKAALELAPPNHPSDDTADESADHGADSGAGMDAATLGENASARVRQLRARGAGRIPPPQPTDQQEPSGPPLRRPLRAFLLTWGDLDGWSAHYDPAEISAQIKDCDWAMFERVLAETIAFAEQVRHLRHFGHPATA